MEKRIAEIIARCKEIDASQAEIERKCQLENDGKFTDEQRQGYAAFKAEYDALIAEKKQLESDAEMRAARSGRADELQPKVIARKAPGESGAPLSGEPVERESHTEGTIRFKIPANVRRVGTLTNFSGAQNGYSAEERAFRFGHYALAKLTKDLPHRYSFPDSVAFCNNYMGGIHNVAHGSDATTGGHFLVPEEFSSDLIVLRERYGVVRRLFQSKTMTSDTLHVPKRASGLTAYFVAENDAITESNMTWSDVLLVAKDLAAIARMSNQLSSDAVISVGDELAGEIAYAFANKEDECGLIGTGTSTYGGIRGAKTLLDDIDGAGTDSAGKVIQATSNTWATQVLADFNNVVGKLPQFADTPNTCWVCHRTYYYSVMQKLEMAAGGAQMMEIAQGDRRSRPLFMGYPVEFAQVMPSATATTGLMCLLGDFKLGALFGDRAQNSIAFSEHAYVNSQSVFERNQIAVRGTERFDIVVHGCGTASVVGPIVGLATA